jgi:serum/glucocorticoid-regulated kinase 2
MAIDQLHLNGFIYRDLRLENILIDENGYIKIAEFGIAKKLKDNERTFTFCGAPEYISPEIILGVGHNKSTDWWSLGIAIYEMLFGIPPFYVENTQRMYELICNAEVSFPRNIPISSDCHDLITRLLDKNPSNRLGSKRGFNEIKSHSFFSSMNIEAIFNRKITPCFIPTNAGNFDAQYFDEDFTMEDMNTSVIEEKEINLIKANIGLFDQF